MQNLKLSLLALAVMAVPGLKAASATPEKDTKAKAQTAVTQYVPAPLPEDRATFVQSMAQMTPPKEAHDKAQAWLVANPEVVNAALGNEPLIAGPSFRALHENTWKVLAAAGSPVLFQNANYVFRPFPGWIIKIGGHANRRYNLCPLTATDCVNPLAFNKASWDKACAMKEACDEQGYPITYQTISRMLGHWLVKQAIAQKEATRVAVPEKGLVHIPGRSKRVCDKNYVVLTQDVPNLQNIDQLSLLERAQMEEVIKASGLWDANKNNLKRVGVNGQIMPVDFELRNCWSPASFPYVQGTNAFESDVRVGLENFKKAFAVQAAQASASSAASTASTAAQAPAKK